MLWNWNYKKNSINNIYFEYCDVYLEGKKQEFFLINVQEEKARLFKKRKYLEWDHDQDTGERTSNSLLKIFQKERPLFWCWSLLFFVLFVLIMSIVYDVLFPPPLPCKEPIIAISSFLYISVTYICKHRFKLLKP